MRKHVYTCVHYNTIQVVLHEWRVMIILVECSRSRPSNLGDSLIKFLSLKTSPHFFLSPSFSLFSFRLLSLSSSSSFYQSLFFHHKIINWLPNEFLYFFLIFNTPWLVQFKVVSNWSKDLCNFFSFISSAWIVISNNRNNYNSFPRIITMNVHLIHSYSFYNFLFLFFSKRKFGGHKTLYPRSLWSKGFEGW